MRNQWFGDEGDFVKYQLLRKICGITAEDGRAKLSLGVVWYLRESKRTSYLQDSERKEEDPKLYDRLQRWNEDEKGRGISLVEFSNLFPCGTTWFREPLPSGSAREEWLNNARKAVAPCRVVFLDPDVGLAPEKPTGDHVLSCELDEFYCLEQRPTVVVYQHSWHMKRAEQIKKQIESQADHIKYRIVAVQHKKLTDRFFYMVPSTKDDGQLVRERITEPFELIEIGSR